MPVSPFFAAAEPLLRVEPLVLLLLLPFPVPGLRSGSGLCCSVGSVVVATGVVPLLPAFLSGVGGAALVSAPAGVFGDVAVGSFAGEDVAVRDVLNVFVGGKRAVLLLAVGVICVKSVVLLLAVGVVCVDCIVLLLAAGVGFAIGAVGVVSVVGRVGRVVVGVGFG